MQNKTVAVFTPTYNRAYKLPDLFNALKRQTSDDFVWIVVDDGSTDGTNELISGYSKEAKFEIRYIYQENGGKQRAQNTAIAHCSEELLFTIDSDDYPTDNAIEAITSEWAKWRNDKTISGLVALYGKTSTSPLIADFPHGLKTTKVYDLYAKSHFRGDAQMIYRTDILREYPFDVAEGERFIAETYIMLQIDDNYDLAVFNCIVAIHEYLPDGYTHNARKITRENPIGYMRVKKLYMDRAKTLKDKIESTALFLVGAHYANKSKEAYKTIDNPLVAAISGMISFILVRTLFTK